MTEDRLTIEYGRCHCGCGGKTNLASETRAGKGWVKGEPMRFIHGHSHSRRLSTPEYIKEDRGFDTPCHIWQRCADRHGYGRRVVGGKDVMAHRHAYEQAHGSIPTGLQLDHLCRISICVNPEHLEPVTCAENIRRGKVTKLTIEQVREIKRRPNEAQRNLASEFGVSPSAIYCIRVGKTWAGVRHKDEGRSA